MTTDWHRADQGDLPERGMIISLVRWPADPKDTAVKVYERMRVEVVFSDPVVKVLGPGLPFEDDLRVELPERPDNPAGQEIIMWKERP